MKHLFINKNSNNTLIMLHGTGSNEEEMVPLALKIDSKANILSIRGNITENGMNRYFKRYAIGNYDIINYKSETNNLINAILKYSKEYNFSLKNAVIAGFSNGANIALGIIQTNPIINNYILYSPDFINKEDKFVDLTNKNIFISTAENDPYVKYENIISLSLVLKNNNANLKIYKGVGHQINLNVLNESIKWYKNIK